MFLIATEYISRCNEAGQFFPLMEFKESATRIYSVYFSCWPHWRGSV